MVLPRSLTKVRVTTATVCCFGGFLDSLAFCGLIWCRFMLQSNVRIFWFVHTCTRHIYVKCGYELCESFHASILDRSKLEPLSCKYSSVGRKSHPNMFPKTIPFPSLLLTCCVCKSVRNRCSGFCLNNLCCVTSFREISVKQPYFERSRAHVYPVWSRLCLNMAILNVQGFSSTARAIAGLSEVSVLRLPV